MLDSFSKLPVELIHKVLDNVSTFDILTSVCLLSKHLRIVSLAYPRFRLDFTCSFKKKKQFEKICTQLVSLSSQIISITLSAVDDETIPTQIDYLFLRSITINNTFSRLHSVSLSYVDRGIWNLLKSRLTSFVFVKSISIHFLTDNEPSSPLLASIILTELLFFSSSLKYLSLQTFNYSSDIAIIDRSHASATSSIEYLNLGEIVTDLKLLFTFTPALISFISTADYCQFIKDISEKPSVNLQQLSIVFDGITLDIIECLLSSMPYLIHFTLVAENVQKDMGNGERWAQLLSAITTFKFKLTFSQNAFIQKPLDFHSFETNFWLVEKKWYVTHDWCIDTHYSLLYSNPYCHKRYPFDQMIGTFVTESTGSELPKFPYVEHIDVWDRSLVNNTLLRRCTHVYSLGLYARNLDQTLSWRRFTTYLDLTKITCLAMDTIDLGTSSDDATVQLVYGLSSLRSLRVSVAIFRLLLVYNWPHIVHLAIIWGSDGSSKLLTPNETDSFCHSFNCVEQLEFSRDFFDNIAQVLNSMMMKLIHVVIRHSGCGTPHDDQFISYEWLQRNTKLRNFGYLYDKQNDVHLWL